MKTGQLSLLSISVTFDFDRMGEIENAPNASEPDVMINILGTKNTEKKGKSAQN